jgi:hypothetical protein
METERTNKYLSLLKSINDNRTILACPLCSEMWSWFVSYDERPHQKDCPLQKALLDLTKEG